MYVQNVKNIVFLHAGSAGVSINNGTKYIQNAYKISLSSSLSLSLSPNIVYQCVYTYIKYIESLDHGVLKVIVTRGSPSDPRGSQGPRLDWVGTGTALPDRWLKRSGHGSGTWPNSIGVEKTRRLTGQKIGIETNDQLLKLSIPMFNDYQLLDFQLGFKNRYQLLKLLTSLVTITDSNIDRISSKNCHQCSRGMRRIPLKLDESEFH